MRLPTRKVYRAFPELDRFDDQVCESYARRAVRKRWRSFLLVAIGCIISIPVCWVFAVVLPELLYLLMPRFLSAVRRTDLAFPLYVACAFVFPFIVTLFVRDTWFRRAIRSQLVGTACPTCEYQLIGLIVKEGHVHCPECGASVRLADLGLSPEDLIAKSSDSVPSLATASPTPPVQP